MSSKLGPHIQSLTQGVKDWVLLAEPHTVKVLESGNADFWLSCKAQWPMTILGRRPDLAETIDWNDPEGSGRETAAMVLEWASSAPHVDLWEGRNEVVINDADPHTEQAKARAYVRHELAFHQELRAENVRGTLFQFSAGNPFTLDLWGQILWEAPLEAQAPINLHAYSQPTMRSEAEWLTLRHRKVWGLLPMEARTSIIISECGIDGGIWVPSLPAPRPQVGWKGYAADYEYEEQLQWFDSELAKDSYVSGALIFNAGSLSPWESFEIAGLDSLARYIRDRDTEEGSMDIQEATLRDMWKRQGVDAPANGGNAFWDYALAMAQLDRRAIIPQPSKDGNFENHSDPTFVIAYTIPAMYAVRGQWVVREGLPPLI